MEKESGVMSFLAGLLLGGLVGTGIGMLVAPETGDKTRTKLKKVSSELADKSKDAFDKFNADTLKPAIKRAEIEIKNKVKEVSKSLKK